MTKVVDFPRNPAIDIEAAEWLARLDGDTPLSTEEREEFSEWVSRDFEHGRRIRELAMLSDELNVLTELATPLGQPPPKKRELSVRPTWINKIVPASISGVVLALGVWGASYWYNGISLAETNGFYATALGDQTPVSLSDGSTIMLNTDTQLRVTYSRDFRDIHLIQGEAHFTVEENLYSPFRVFAGNGRIDAVGTAFSVYLKDDLIEVAVTEGRVELASSSGVPGTVTGIEYGNPASTIQLGELVAGQTASISLLQSAQASGAGSLDVVEIIEDEDLSEMLSWRDGVLIFSGEPLEDVVEEISRYTIVTIELEGPDVRGLRIGGRFPVGETDAMFAALARDFGLRVTRLSANHVVISADESD